MRVVYINYICMDIDNSGDVTIDIADLLYLTEYMFDEGPLPLHPASADLNCDGLIDISDPVILTEYMFDGGPPGTCCHSLDEYKSPVEPKEIGQTSGVKRE